MELAVLIETLWNVKVIINKVIPVYGRCINRNIVECKVVFVLSFLDVIFRINRNIVECKEIHAYLKLQTSYVLIETLWNVKRANISDIMA